MAAHVRSESDAAQTQMDQLRSYLGNLADAFTGQAADSFNEAFSEWWSGSKQMLEGLTSLGNFLTNAANIIEEADAEIARQLRG